MGYEDTYDVLVVGGGPAGVCAAIAASKEGAKTLLIERYGFLGGSTTAGLLGKWSQVKEEGIAGELVEALRRMGPLGRGYCYDIEAAKVALEEMAMDSGVHLLYDSLFVEPIMDGKTIRGVVVENRSGRCTFHGKVIIDASGDADVAARAGVPCQVGRPSDGYHQAMSLMFMVGNVDIERFLEYWKEDVCLRKALRAAKEAGDITFPQDAASPMAILPGRREVLVNAARVVKLKAIDAKDMTQAHIESRRQVREMDEFFRKYVPGFEESYVLSTAPLMGIRESRKIEGEYVLTGDDVVGAAKFPDAVARSSANVDIHNPIGEGYVHGFEKEMEDGSIAKLRIPKGEYYEIPYRCMVPKEVDGLLVTGRCISSTHEGQSAFRLVGTCMALGEASGIAGAMAVKMGINPRSIDGRLISQLSYGKRKI
jgi:hypothetical protein